jgi:hypothetical protein
MAQLASPFGVRSPFSVTHCRYARTARLIASSRDPADPDRRSLTLGSLGDDRAGDGCGGVRRNHLYGGFR